MIAALLCRDYSYRNLYLLYKTCYTFLLVLIAKMGVINSRSMLQYSDELLMQEERQITMPRELLSRHRNDPPTDEENEIKSTGCVAPDKNETKRILDFFRLDDTAGVLIGECIVCYGEKPISSFVSTSCFHVICKSCLVKAELVKEDKPSTCIYCRRDVDRIFIMKQQATSGDVTFLPTTLKRLMYRYRMIAAIKRNVKIIGPWSGSQLYF